MVDHDDDTPPEAGEGQAAPVARDAPAPEAPAPPAAAADVGPWDPTASSPPGLAGEGERVAKALARAGVASRREVERYIAAGRVALNGQVLTTPAVKIAPGDILTVDGAVVGGPEPTRLFRYHKPSGLITTNSDPQGRPTVFEHLPAWLPRVLAVGRLDLNTEGLLLLTNDGALSRALELPSSGWLRRYRARAYGGIDQATLDGLSEGVTVDGVAYGPIEARIDKASGHDRETGAANVWISIGITEGKNREVRKVLEHLGLKVNRLIRLAYGPFALSTLPIGEVEEVGPRVIREQLAEHVAPENLPKGERAAAPPPSAGRGARVGAAAPARRAPPARTAPVRQGGARGAVGPSGAGEGAERRLAESPFKKRSTGVQGAAKRGFGKGGAPKGGAPGGGASKGGAWSERPRPPASGKPRRFGGAEGADLRGERTRGDAKPFRAAPGRDEGRGGGRGDAAREPAPQSRAPRGKPVWAGSPEAAAARGERPRPHAERPREDRGQNDRSRNDGSQGDRSQADKANPSSRGPRTPSVQGPARAFDKEAKPFRPGGKPARNGGAGGASAHKAIRKPGAKAPAASAPRTGLELTPPMRRTPRGSGPRRPPRKD